MTENEFAAWAQRKSLTMSNSWRRHRLTLGNWQLMTGPFASLFAVCVLVPGVNSYVKVTYIDQSGDPSLPILIMGIGSVMLATGAVLTSAGYLKRRAAEKRTLTYDDLP